MSVLKLSQARPSEARGTSFVAHCQLSFEKGAPCCLMKRYASAVSHEPVHALPAGLGYMLRTLCQALEGTLGSL